MTAQPSRWCRSTDLPDRLPHHAENQITAEEYTARIADRQVGIARRMIS